MILTRFVVHRRPMTTRSRAFPTFLFVGSDTYCKRFQALLSILLTLLPAIPQLHVRVGAVGKFTHEKYGRPPRVIRFRCFVRFAGSLPLAPSPSLPLLPPFPPRRLSPPVVSPYPSHIQYAHYSFIGLTSTSAIKRREISISDGQYPLGSLGPLFGACSTFHSEKQKIDRSRFRPAYPRRDTLSTRYRDNDDSRENCRGISRFAEQTKRLMFVKLYGSIFFTEGVERLERGRGGGGKKYATLEESRWALHE